MGLDITAYRGLQEVRPVNKDVDDDGGDDALVSLYAHPDFDGRFAGLKEETLYSFEDEFGFRAGSYGGYNAWREWLAKLAGYPLTAHKDSFGGGRKELHAAACWDGATGPFAELINFSDCEGVIGPVVSAKLAKDFIEWDLKAKAESEGNPFFYDRFAEWRKAFGMAADNGAVKFH